MLQAGNVISILLVEDDEDDFLLTREYIADAYPKFNLDWFQHAEPALNAVKNNHYDVILLDYFIGKDNGLDLAVKIQEQLTHSVPIILLTGQEQEDTDIRAINAGAEDYLVKQDLSASLLKRAFRNATTRQQARNAMLASEMRLRTIMRTITDCIITTDQDGNIQSTNPPVTELLGYSETEILSQNIEQLIPAFLTLLNSDTSRVSHVETTALTRTKQQIPVEVSVSGFSLDGGDHYTCVIRDITERKEAAARIEYQAYYDALTDLPNRRMLMTQLDHAIQNAQRHSYFGALLFLDLDRFKHLNDSLGHAVGDLLLQEVAARLKNTLRDVDTIARLGGDEFVVLLERVQDNEKKTTVAAHHIAEKIQAEINKPYLLEGTEFHFSTSIGIAMFPNGNGDTVDELIKHADSAMYQAKQQGRNEIRFYHPSIQNAANTRLTMEAELRAAIAQNQFELYYQPHINARSELIGCEALIRWNHPQRGLLNPNDFIPMAEESGLIVPIGEWVIETALANGALFFRDLPKNYMAVNVSPLQFRQSNFVRHIDTMIKQHEYHDGQFILELTESTLIDNIDVTINKMLALKRLGVYTSIDDFGTGYSSLTYLKRLPIQQLKIDRSFISDIIVDTDNRAIVEAILAMARHLQIDVIAEGVEDKETFHCLLQKGCEMFQGFYFSLPLRAPEFGRLVQANLKHSVCNIAQYYADSGFCSIDEHVAIQQKR